MTIIAHRIFKFESMIKKPTVENHAFCTSITLSGINSFAYQFYLYKYINSIVIQLIRSNFHEFQKDFIKVIYHSPVYNFISIIV